MALQNANPDTLYVFIKSLNDFTYLIQLCVV